MVGKIFEIINSYLADWNPLNVPKQIAKSEYTDLIPIIKEVLDGTTSSMDKIEDYLLDIIGIGFENKEVLKDVNNLLVSIRNDLIEKNIE